MTTLTNSAILLAARETEVTCGGCRMAANPARVLGIVGRVVRDRDLPEDVVARTISAIVEYRCRTPDCEIGVGPGVACEVPL